ncbi:hypothetical protein BDE02_15G100100 [Populus trichocarpa]|nr:hypothetical protein BDE02_15G100100 [Populus trichocarpa]
MAVIFTSLRYLSVYSFEYQIGGNENLVVPPPLIPESTKDSVMKVRAEDYKKRNSRHPNFFSNTVHHLNHPASSYFISGVSGHCEKGQRMIIIKVISTDQETNSNLQLFLLQEC